ERVALFDIIPVAEAFNRADARFALAYWPWSLLAQPEPLPERILAAAADAIVEHALGGWGSPGDVFPGDVRAAYVEALRAPGHAHAICEEYRAAAGIDREHDQADRAQWRRITCPLLVLWSARGPLESWYTAEAGPLALWSPWADDLQGRALDAGHFFPEERPQETADALGRFFAAGPSLSPGPP
ncbi:MAG TPA: alpha/beta hydrolase, partial [Vicinamibacteria bacterium]